MAEPPGQTSPQQDCLTIFVTSRSAARDAYTLLPAFSRHAGIVLRIPRELLRPRHGHRRRRYFLRLPIEPSSQLAVIPCMHSLSMAANKSRQFTNQPTAEPIGLLRPASRQAVGQVSRVGIHYPLAFTLPIPNRSSLAASIPLSLLTVELLGQRCLLGSGLVEQPNTYMPTNIKWSGMTSKA